MLNRKLDAGQTWHFELAPGARMVAVGPYRADFLCLRGHRIQINRVD
jgi:hypothetical protein